MRYGTVPPAAIGLLAGLLTSTAVIALSATGLLPESVFTPFLVVAGGLAAGLADCAWDADHADRFYYRRVLAKAWGEVSAGLGQPTGGCCSVNEVESRCDL